MQNKLNKLTLNFISTTFIVFTVGCTGSSSLTTPMIEAAEDGNTAAVEALLAAGVDVNEKDAKMPGLSKRRPMAVSFLLVIRRRLVTAGQTFGWFGPVQMETLSGRTHMAEPIMIRGISSSKLKMKAS